MTELFQAMGQMDNMTIGLWITGLMLVLVILGLRVAFAAAVAGFMGLVWIFSAKLGFEKGFIVAAKMAGTIPHSKVSSVALSLIPTFILTTPILLLLLVAVILELRSDTRSGKQSRRKPMRTKSWYLKRTGRRRMR